MVKRVQQKRKEAEAEGKVEFVPGVGGKGLRRVVRT